jgi:hypothetical protein
MSNTIHYKLDVLASSPAEINQIAERLNQPSLELANRIAQKDGLPVNEAVEALKELLAFKTVANLGNISNEANKARCFSLGFRSKWGGIVDSHLFEISAAFPKAIFLLEYFDDLASYSGKQVMRAGAVVQHVFDGDQKVQGLDWALLDIFAPFKAEYYGEHDFSSLWTPWLDAIMAAAKSLRDKQGPANTGTPEPATDK